MALLDVGTDRREVPPERRDQFGEVVQTAVRGRLGGGAVATGKRAGGMVARQYRRRA
jgi:hypothetical protein